MSTDNPNKPAFFSPRAHLIFWLIVAGGIVADLWSKSAIFNWLKSQPFETYTVIDGLFDLVIRENTGAAWGIAAGKTTMLISFSVIAVLFVSVIYFMERQHHVLVQVALAMFTSGILGNLYDRLFNGGKVRDFLDFYIGEHHWPAFNLADSMLCIAVGLLLLSSFPAKPQTQNRECE